MSSPSGPEPDTDSGERNQSEEVKPDAGFAGLIQNAIRRLFNRFVSADGLTVDYDALFSSGEYRSYELESRQLTDFNPLALELREERLAFWINLYNMTGLQAVGTLGGASSVKDVKGFFERKVCNLGGIDYSLDDIEYGILRGNARKSNRVWKQFRKWDPRVRLSLDSPEPRVCFALVRAVRSSPSLRFYQAEQIEGQLHRAAVDFIGNGGVIIDREQGTMSISRIFRIYSRDFGGDQGVMRFIAGHLESPDDAGCLRSRAGKLKVQFQEFSWALNGAI